MSPAEYRGRIISLLGAFFALVRRSNAKKQVEFRVASGRLFRALMQTAARPVPGGATTAVRMSAARIALSCVVSTAWFFLPCLALAQQGDMPATIAGGELPLSLSNGFLIVVEGHIGSLSKLKFILDTGTTRSIVDRKVAEELQLPRYPRRMFDIDKFVDVDWAVFPEVQFGPVQVENASLSVADLALFSTLASHVDGLIGADLLSLNSFTIDYDQKKVVFRSLERAASDDLRKLHPPLLTVGMQVQGQLVHLLVDTGFPEILVFEDRLLKRITQLKSEHATGEFSVAGRLLVRRVTLPAVQLGTTRASFRVLLAQGPPDKIMPGVDGLLGTAALKARRINVNFVTQTFDWEN